MEMRPSPSGQQQQWLEREAGGREADEEAVAVIRVGEDEEREEGLVAAIPKGRLGALHTGIQDGWVRAQFREPQVP